ncbi:MULTISPECIES: hypothetical protein [unclassified Pseudomonas]|uniref:hypothetical protein n=1 Tax=unclassified Pseudomonas TaxID=196821 RepID=UPI00244B2892|nr:MULTISPECIES: hypothetical protein [unclassified Pseudomonas]MDG9929669.1 hypothetical protein [Pseudomonas sp. GD04042]MDH0483444.1 hypothetical protein [Pseudomonas sp. GD04015]MDH0604753.1 hypothetical protein [Pseudomonas sp. GD03869]
MKPSTRQLLERYDELGSYEFHSAFDYPDMEARANEVARRLETNGNRLTFEGAIYNQDASFSIAILLHDYERAEDRLTHCPTIRFSNFGNLVSLTWSELLPGSDLERTVQELEACGFTFIPEAELSGAYDGVMPDRKLFDSWWTRYFDWI